jgi:DNA-binding transcriptional LysR family regulator
MELRHLRYFVAVAEAGSFTKAAQALHIQQPPLGQQIRDLETELGVALFDRYPRKIVLNSTGEVFLADAREILARAAQAVDNVRRYDQGESGHLAVGFTSSASLHVLAPEFLQRFRATFPLAEIDVEESETYELILALQQQRIDAALLHIDAHRFPDLVSASLSHEDMLVAVPRTHRLADERLGPLTLPMLAQEQIVAYRRPDGPGIFERIEKAFDDAGLTPMIVDETYRIITAVNLVAGDRGITLVPASLQIVHREAVIYRALARGELPPLGLYVAYRRANRLALVRNFIDTTKRIAAEANARDSG